MRTASRWIATILFLILMPLWLLLLVPKLNGFNPEVLKGQFQQHNVYEQLSQLLQQSTPTQSESSSNPDEQQPEVTDQALLVFRGALTPEYIEQKSVEVIDESAAWLTNQQQQPTVSFNDIKDEVVESYPAAQNQIDDLTTQLQQAQEQLEGQPVSADGVPGLEGDGSTSSIEIAEMLKQADSLDNFAAGDFSLELGSMLQPVKQAFDIYSLALPIAGVALLLLLAAMVALGQNWHSRAKWVGWVLVISAVGNAVLSAIFSVVVLKIGLDVITGMIPGQAEAAGSLVRAVSAAVFADYIQLELIMSGILLAIGVALLVAALVIKKRSKAIVADAAVEAKVSKTADQLGVNKSSLAAKNTG